MAIQHGIVEKVKPDNGKLFIGGISWDTDEDRLKEYFSSYGEVIEAVIMRDRVTGRARGFGFVVFVDPVVAERVVMDKHMIDGRTVEAKKAVPREDHHGLNRAITSIQGSPVGLMGRTKKIFVGGLPSNITETDFKDYFDQFGTITDVVVMYDHNTQRPRGFGFITYDSEEAVDRVLYKTFHELNGKMVEVKRAVPKELSPGPNRSSLIGYNHGFSRANSSSFPQGFNMSPISGYGVRMDSRFGLAAGGQPGRTGFPQFSPNAYGAGLNVEPVLSPTAFGGSSGYGRVLSPYFGGSPTRYSTPIGYNQGSGRTEAPLGSSTRNVWGNGGLTSPSGPGSYLGSGSGGFGVFGNNGANWGSLPSQNGWNAGGLRVEEGSYGYGLMGRNNVIGGTATSLFNGPNNGHQGYNGNLDRAGSSSIYGDASWEPSANDVDGPGPFGLGLGLGLGLSDTEDVVGREGYVGNYSIANRQTSREIAA